MYFLAYGTLNAKTQEGDTDTVCFPTQHKLMYRQHPIFLSSPRIRKINNQTPSQPNPKQHLLYALRQWVCSVCRSQKKGTEHHHQYYIWYSYRLRKQTNWRIHTVVTQVMIFFRFHPHPCPTIYRCARSRSHHMVAGREDAVDRPSTHYCWRWARGDTVALLPYFRLDN